MLRKSRSNQEGSPIAVTLKFIEETVRHDNDHRPCGSGATAKQYLLDVILITDISKISNMLVEEENWSKDCFATKRSLKKMTFKKIVLEIAAPF